MDSAQNNTIASGDMIRILHELKAGIDQLTEKIEAIAFRLDGLTESLSPEEPSELENYLQLTLNALITLDKKKNGVPVSRTALAEELNVHPNTAYVRAEKLVERKKALKFYGRDLEFEDKKAVFYGPPRSLYDQKVIQKLQKENELAYRIALTLLQKPRKVQDLLELLDTKNYSEPEAMAGLSYLLNRGLIIRRIINKEVQYRIRPLEKEEERKTENKG
jgi:hypothetical protein